jgi:hypothetical protein
MHRVSVRTLSFVAAALVALAIQRPAFAQRGLPMRHGTRARAASTPAGVPADYVITPNGFFHPSCVVTLARDERLDPDLVVRTLDGASRAFVAPCAYPRFDLRGRTIDAGTPTSGSPPEPAGPIEPAGAAWDGYPVLYSYTGSSWGAYLSDTWVVPPPPTDVASGEVIFLWNAIQTSNSLLQPVLGFNDDGSNMEWQISSWNCCTSGISGQTGGTPVNPGDVIQGTVTGAGCDDGTGVCANWTVTAIDQTSGQSEVLNTTSPNGTPQNIDPGVIETYGVTSCDMFPPTGEEAFYDHTLNDVNGNPVSLSYDLITLVDPDPSLPSCGYTGTNSGSTYTLIFSATPTDDAGPCITPSGSYLESCTSCFAGEGSSGCVLSCASCTKIDGTQSSGPTLALPCSGSISNDDGALECTPSTIVVDAGEDAGIGEDASTSPDDGGLDSGESGEAGPVGGESEEAGSISADSGPGLTDAAQLLPPSFDSGSEDASESYGTPGSGGYTTSSSCGCATAKNMRSPGSIAASGGLILACIWRRQRRRAKGREDRASPPG